MTGAVQDCERVLEAILSQPVNSLTSLAFVGAGLVIWVRTPRRWVAIASVATGVGSFLFHGPMVPGSQWAHDVSLVWLLVVAGASGTRIQSWSTWPALIALGIWLAITPGLSDAVAGVASAAAIASILWRDRSSRTVVAFAILAAAALVGRLGATDGPLCRPDSLFQPHGLWHLAAAAAVTLWATARTPYDQDRQPATR